MPHRVVVAPAAVIAAAVVIVAVKSKVKLYYSAL